MKTLTVQIRRKPIVFTYIMSLVSINRTPLVPKSKINIVPMSRKALLVIINKLDQDWFKFRGYELSCGPKICSCGWGRQGLHNIMKRMETLIRNCLVYRRISKYILKSWFSSTLEVFFVEIWVECFLVFFLLKFELNVFWLFAWRI